MPSLLQHDSQEPSERMRRNRINGHIRDAFHGRVYQSLAILFCVLFGLAMIVNTQMGGEADWFWYTTLFHHGAKLYADLHLPLQPLFVLEMDVWIKLFGSKLLVTEIPSLIHVLILCLGLFLLLRESDWPDWQKAIVLASSFVLWVVGSTYRFDDYHVTTECFILYSLILLLYLPRTNIARQQLVLAAGLGILCGFTIMTRLNDGAALMAATCLSLLVLARTRRLMLCSLFVVTVALTVVLIVRLTGDSLSAWVSDSVIRAAATKGGTSNLLADPFRIVPSAFESLRGGKWIALCEIAVVAAGVLVQRWEGRIKFVVLVQLGMAGIGFLILFWRRKLFYEIFVDYSVPPLIIVTYLLGLVVVSRYTMWKLQGGRGRWDPREILVLLPLAELASVSTSAAGQARTGYYSQIAILLLLLPVIQPFRKQISWANASFLTFLLLLGIDGVAEKIRFPYFWNGGSSHPMFREREWYQHPVYGPMYIDRDLLQFSRHLGTDMGEGASKPELLSLPFAYFNYFFDTPPWHGYVQTYFDTSTQSDIQALTRELQEAPPQWIFYQRETQSMDVYEKVYHGGRPMAQRDLDNLIMHKIATRQWQVIDEGTNLMVGSEWYLIRTRP
jgi:hypothetical protein